MAPRTKLPILPVPMPTCDVCGEPIEARLCRAEPTTASQVEEIQQILLAMHRQLAHPVTVGVGVADEIRSRYPEAIARGEARAAVNIEIGITDLRRELEHAEEWKVTEKADGTRSLEPHRGLLESHLRRIEGARHDQ